MEPTERDIQNAKNRREIADRQAIEYGRVLGWAMSIMGPGWEPSGRHDLIEHDEEERARATGEKPVRIASVYTIKNGAGRKRHFTVVDGKAKECSGYEEGFGDMLHERHPTRGFTHKGEFCRTARYSLCWAGYEKYEPKTAEELAAMRVKRKANKLERDQKRFEAENPLLAWADRVNQEEAENQR